MKPQFKNGKACGEQARYGVVTDYAGAARPGVGTVASAQAPPA